MSLQREQLCLGDMPDNTHLWLYLCVALVHQTQLIHVSAKLFYVHLAGVLKVQDLPEAVLCLM